MPLDAQSALVSRQFLSRQFLLIKHPSVESCPIYLLVKLRINNFSVNKITHMITFNLMTTSGTIPHAQAPLQYRPRHGGNLSKWSS